MKEIRPIVLAIGLGLIMAIMVAAAFRACGPDASAATLDQWDAYR